MQSLVRCAKPYQVCKLAPLIGRIPQKFKILGMLLIHSRCRSVICISHYLHPAVGKHVTVKIPVKEALLYSSNLFKYAIPQKEQKLPQIAPDHFPSLMFVPLAVSSLTGSSPSRWTRKRYSKAEFDSAKRKLDFSTPNFSKTILTGQGMPSLELRMTSVTLKKQPFQYRTSETEQIPITPDITNSVESRQRCFLVLFYLLLQ